MVGSDLVIGFDQTVSNSARHVMRAGEGRSFGHRPALGWRDDIQEFGSARKCLCLQRLGAPVYHKTQKAAAKSRPFLEVAKKLTPGAFAQPLTKDGTA